MAYWAFFFLSSCWHLKLFQYCILVFQAYTGLSWNLESILKEVACIQGNYFYIIPAYNELGNQSEMHMLE